MTRNAIIMAAGMSSRFGTIVTGDTEGTSECERRN